MCNTAYEEMSTRSAIKVVRRQHPHLGRYMLLSIQRSSQMQLPLFVYLALYSSVLGQVPDLLNSLTHFIYILKKRSTGQVILSFCTGQFLLGAWLRFNLAQSAASCDWWIHSIAIAEQRPRSYNMHNWPRRGAVMTCGKPPNRSMSQVISLTPRGYF